MRNFVGKKRFLKDSESVSRQIWLKIGQKLRVLWTFLAKMLGKKVKRFASNRSFEKEMKNREGIAFFCFCFLIFCLSVGMTLFSTFQYQQKVKDLEKLRRYTDHLKKDNLLLLALDEEEKRNNELSLAVDYGYAFSQDFVVALKYPEVKSSDNFYFWQLFIRHWEYLMILSVVVITLFLYKHLGFFVDVDRQELALQRLSTVFPSLIHEMPTAVPEQNKESAVKSYSQWKHSRPATSEKKDLFFSWWKKWRIPQFFSKKRGKRENGAKTNYFRYFRSHFYQHKKTGNR